MLSARPGRCHPHLTHSRLLMLMARSLLLSMSAYLGIPYCTCDTQYWQWRHKTTSGRPHRLWVVWPSVRKITYSFGGTSSPCHLCPGTGACAQGVNGDVRIVSSCAVIIRKRGVRQPPWWCLFTAWSLCCTNVVMYLLLLLLFSGNIGKPLEFNRCRRGEPREENEGSFTKWSQREIKITVLKMKGLARIETI